MNSEENSPSVDQGSTGQTLRRARESAGLTVAQVAENQHLRPSIIQAIEEGNYRQIDSELFLKGYVRTYAGMVGLNADSMVASLDKELEPLRKEKTAAEEVNPLHDIEQRKRQKARVAKGVFFLLVVVVLAFLAYRFLSTPGDSIVPEPSAESEPAAEQQELPADEDNRIDPSDEPESISPESGQNADGEFADGVSGSDELTAEGVGSNQTTLVGADPDGEANLTASDNGLSDDNNVTVDESVNADVMTDRESGAGALENQPSSDGRNDGSDALAQNLFTASFSGDCWVQVTDARGRTLISALRQSGERVSVEGTPPLRIVLGAADAVEQLEFAGESVDLSSYRVVNNRIEFTLDV